MQPKLYASIAADSIHLLIYTGEGVTFAVAVRLEVFAVLFLDRPASGSNLA